MNPAAKDQRKRCLDALEATQFISNVLLQALRKLDADQRIDGEMGDLTLGFHRLLELADEIIKAYSLKSPHAKELAAAASVTKNLIEAEMSRNE